MQVDGGVFSPVRIRARSAAARDTQLARKRLARNRARLVPWGVLPFRVRLLPATTPSEATRGSRGCCGSSQRRRQQRQPGPGLSGCRPAPAHPAPLYRRRGLRRDGEGHEVDAELVRGQQRRDRLGRVAQQCLRARRALGHRRLLEAVQLVKRPCAARQARQTTLVARAGERSE